MCAFENKLLIPYGDLGGIAIFELDFSRIVLLKDLCADIEVLFEELLLDDGKAERSRRFVAGSEAAV